VTRVLLPLAFVAGFAGGVVAGCTGLAARDGHAQWYEPPPEIAAPLDTAAARYGLRSQFLRCLAWHEARYQPGAVSPGWRYVGLLQFDSQTWWEGSHLAGLPHADRTDAWAASEVAALLIWRGEVGRWGPAGWCGSPW
jgi:hypothetical protein